jgi:type III secretion protein C
LIVRRSARSAVLSFVLAAGIGVGSVLSSPPASAGPPPWQDAPFTFYAERKPLRTVLREFAAAFSLSVQMPDDLSGSVNGRFSTSSPTEFIDRLGSTYGFVWFTHAGTLFISRTQDMVVRSIAGGATGAGNKLKQVLTDLKVLDPRFGWGDLPDQGIVIVSGPPAYVQLVESTIKALPRTPGGQQVAVFRLKHASVEDRTISFRERQIVTPGIAQILRNLVLGTNNSIGQRGPGDPSGNADAGLNPAVAALASRLAVAPSGPNEGLQPGMAGTASAGRPVGTADQGAALPNIGLGRLRPSIQADPRINAVIVQDTPDRIPIYAELIAQLDVPTPLIEIEALIIDVNTNRLEELGISWSSVSRGGGTALGFGNTSQTTGAISIIQAARGAGVNPSSTIVANSAEFFVARLRLLEQQGDASIQARPSILTTENVGAVIDLSETFYIQTTSERAALVTPVTAGTTLRVTPRLTGEGATQKVRLSVDIEDGQIQQQNPVGNIPTVRRGTVSTEASVMRDESLLIGGYNSVQTITGVDKVPLLGDLPIIGTLFSNSSTQVQRRERLFLIRPTVIGDGARTVVSETPAAGGGASVPAAAFPAVAPTAAPASAPPRTATVPPAGASASPPSRPAASGRP